MKVRETAKFFVFRFASYEIVCNHGNSARRVPADVYVSKSQFHQVALDHGWGDAHPNAPGKDGQTVGDVLFHALNPERVCRLF
jgi:hypothetical protein